MKPKVRPDFFIKFFSMIPARRWTVDTFGKTGARRCALGHCFDFAKKQLAAPAMDIFQPIGVPESQTIDKRGTGRKPSLAIVQINDGFHPKYQQRTPRARILAALSDIKKGAAKRRA